MRFKATHGHTSRGQTSPEYYSFVAMKSRCYNPRHVHFKDYGGRGIIVCDKWKNDFSAFFADVGSRPSALHSLDRYPNRNGNYEPGNVRWATAKEQAHNRKSTRLIEVDGKPRPLVEVARERGINWVMVCGRLTRGWPAERALEEPVKRGRRKATDTAAGP